MDDHDDDIRLGLGLGLGFAEYNPKIENPKTNKRLFLSFPLQESDDNLKVKAVEGENSSGIGSKDQDDDRSFSNDFGRKKLRLTRDQTTLLEECFRQQTTLNMAQKQTLAEKLKLKPRQVEVWFQNRRARTKLKQTEVDCDFLKKKCERLQEENRRLKEEVLKLRSTGKLEQ
ncbi:hypothetical protein M569_10634, partial [Genlisea aurea]